MKLLKASKILHVIVLLCCFLPAIFSGCEDSPSKKELEERAKAVQDSIAQVTSDTLQINASDTATAETKIDTTIVDTTVTATITDNIKNDTTVAESNIDTSAVKNTESSNEMMQDLLTRLIFSDRKNLSITGYMLWGFSSSCPILFMFMLIWSILLRFTSSNHKLIFILTLIGFITLTIFMPDKFKDLLWGFWLVYFLSLFNAILNWRIYFEAKRDKQINVWGDF